MSTKLRLAAIALSFAAGTTVAAAAGTINLTSQQQQKLSQELASQPAEQAPSGFDAQVGEKAPASLKLQQLPSQATTQVPSLEGKEFAKFESGEIIVVDPSNQEIVAVINEGGTTGSSGSMNRNVPNSSK